MINTGIIQDTVSKALAPRFYGKYRGTVVDNVDPDGLARVQVLVPAVSKTPLGSWATACTPVGGLQHGMFMVPPLRAGVWVEFEHGNPDHPVWTGCFYGAGFESPKQAPPAHPVYQSITLQTPTQHCLIIDDRPGTSGGIQIRFHGGTVLSISEALIRLDNGLASIELNGAEININANKVTINDGALMVTKF